MTVLQLVGHERTALQFVMGARYENVVETREQTGDDEYNTVDETECVRLVVALGDLDFDPDTVPSLTHLYDAIWIALDTPEAFPDLDFAALKAAAAKLGFVGEDQP